jgi:glutaredoxin 2
MTLTAEEIKRIDAVLEALKQSLKDEAPEIKKHVKVDDAFLSTIAENYFSATGILSLLSDVHFLTRGDNCTCGCSCAQPSHGPDTY